MPGHKGPRASYCLREGLPTIARARVGVERTVSVREAAKTIGVSHTTLYRWLKHGRRGVRLEPSTLLDFIRRSGAA